MRIKRTLVLVVLSLSLAAGAAAAGDGDSAPADRSTAMNPGGTDSLVPSQAAPAGAAAEVKAAKGVENREPVDEGTSFAAGERVYVWSRITGAKDTTIKHVWKKDGNAVWTASLPVRSIRWTTYSRRLLQAGQYQVDVLAEDGSVLGSVSFGVQ